MAAEPNALSRMIATYNGFLECTITPDPQQPNLGVIAYTIKRTIEGQISRCVSYYIYDIEFNRLNEPSFVRFTKEIVLLPKKEGALIADSMASELDKSIPSYFEEVHETYQKTSPSPCAVKASSSNQAITCNIYQPSEDVREATTNTQFEILTPELVFFAALSSSDYRGAYPKLAEKICSLSKENLTLIQQSIANLQIRDCSALETRVNQLFSPKEEVIQS